MNGIKLFFLAAVATIYPAIVIGFYTKGNSSIITEISFIILITQSSIILFIFGKPLFKIYFTFSYLFFGVIPYLEYKTKTVYWGGSNFEETTYLLTNIILFFLHTIFFLTYHFLKIKKPIQKNLTKTKKISKETIKIYSFFPNFFIVILSLIIILYINHFSILSTLIRGGLDKELIDLNSPWLTFIQSFFRFLPLITLLAYLVNGPKSVLRTTLLAVPAVLAASPLGMPRFMVAATYLPLLFILFPKLTKGNNVAILIIFSLLFIFPVLSEFRNFQSFENIKISNGFEFLLEGHFDTYQSLARVVQDNIVTWGQQLLGVIFFFVPRTYWPDKPIGSGAEIARIEGYYFSNISASFYTEAFINFGILGCMIFAITLAYYFAKLDRWHTTNYSINNFSIIYYICIGYSIFLLRGDLLSFTANAISIFCALALVFSINSLTFRLHNHLIPKRR